LRFDKPASLPYIFRHCTTIASLDFPEAEPGLIGTTFSDHALQPSVRPAAGRSGSMGSVLVIEDDNGILCLIEAALTRFGYRVETAPDGREGIRKYDHGNFDVVITDYLMPHLDGSGVLQHIRRSARGRTPVVGMSGTPWLLHGAGFDRLLPKPFPLKQLIEVVQDLFVGFMVSEAAPQPFQETPAVTGASV
jgi:CheY-like chemotaxis protein